MNPLSIIILTLLYLVVTKRSHILEQTCNWKRSKVIIITLHFISVQKNIAPKKQMVFIMKRKLTWLNNRHLILYLRFVTPRYQPCCQIVCFGNRLNRGKTKVRKTLNLKLVLSTNLKKNGGGKWNYISCFPLFWR